VSTNTFNYQATANFNDGSCIYGGCTDSIRFGYDPTSTMQFYDPGNETVKYADDTWAVCGGFYVPPAAPPSIRSEFQVTFGTAESCISMFAVFFCDFKYMLKLKFATFMMSLGTHSWSIADMIDASIPCTSSTSPYDTCVRRKLSDAEGRRQLADGVVGRQLSEAIAIDLGMYVPDGMSDDAFVEQLLSIDPAAWSAAFGITITGLTVCRIATDGTKLCAFPPPPAPSSPPADDDTGLPVYLIVIIVLLVLGTLVLVIVGTLWYRRKQQRLKGTAVTPDVAERAVVQPPALPPALPASAGAPAATSLE